MIKNISVYKFVELADLPRLRQKLLEKGRELGLKGTILLSEEGINYNLAGSTEAIDQWLAFFLADERFADVLVKTSFSETIPFRRFWVKIKKEIITLRQPEAAPSKHPVAYITPEQLKQWYDEGREFTILDTRNDYEVEIGTFDGAVDLNIEQFTDFPDALEQSGLSKEKPVVTFCTGGVRCEKAGIVMQQQGYDNVYQLQGGILNYFEQFQGAHYQGDCFVFDDRLRVSPQGEAVDVSNNEDKL